jgi:hypothetical protein
MRCQARTWRWWVRFWLRDRGLTCKCQVYNDSPYGSYLMLFFQDSEGFVSSVYVFASRRLA